MQSPSARPNRVLLVLGLALVAALLGLDLASVAPNRILPGEGVSLWVWLGPGSALVWAFPLLLMALAWRGTPRALHLSRGLVVVALASLPWVLAAFAASRVPDALPQARVTLGAGFWSLLFVLLMIWVELQARLKGATWLLLLPLLSLALALVGGHLESLALMREYASRSGAFHEAVRYHLLLVSAAVGLSLLLAFTLALAMRRFPSLRRGGFALLSLIQTIPSLALFGLLLAPLAWLAARYAWLGELGVQGIGWAPALIALVGYSLLPMTRNSVVALDGVDPRVVEAARGMGMSPGQVFWRVRLPLAAPVILEGIRITTVQAVGLAAVAALIGAGGLGTFIFQGLGQAAMDLVLLGALPILALAVAADGLLSALARLTASQSSREAR
ncbi:ABC transporter permease [Halomonas sp. 328]|uniref:ABC transporter permease n=1 Tax=Halomonas sp. 328 TaxID=2776704 RepID=UPI0018A7D7B2|nr:ABC transporter permease [Halomonas sp. 328]MBF8221527.1 ABC transporter permease [Halomonas sp. 328]